MLSICIIGSQARGTADALSDRDVLMIGTDRSEYEASALAWSTAGWNVSTFDAPAFGRLAQVGSLFVQHVKQDGRIVRDDDLSLLRTLSAYRPKAEYLGERNDALRQIACLPDEDGRYWHDLCLADIAYVLVRNAAILHLASRGRYCFSYDELVTHLADDLRLQDDAGEGLRSLRRLKHAYRSRQDGLDVGGLVDQARETAATIARRVGGLQASAIAEGATTDEYLRLRLRELDLASTLTPPILDAISPDHPLGAAWQGMVRAAGYPKDRPSRLH